jgi:molybdopterin converting factor small subunit
MMHIYVQLRLFASLRHLTPPNADQFPLSPDQTIHDLLVTLDVPMDEVQLVFVNGVKQDVTCPLKDGDRVGIFPPIGGG